MNRPAALLIWGVCAAVACAPPDVDTDEAAAIQVAAAAEVVGDIARNPGPVVAVCVVYAGDWDDGGLPPAPSDSIGVSYMDGCEEVGGRLVARQGGGQAISVSVGPPELTSGSTATVDVHTSTGSVDVEAYACTLRGGQTTWRADACKLQATS